MLEARNAERHSTSCVPPRGRRGGRIGAEIRARRTSRIERLRRRLFRKRLRQLYTPAGRRAMPPLVLPGRAAFVYAQGDSVAVTGDCSLVVGSWGRRVVGGDHAGVRRSAPHRTQGAPRRPWWACASPSAARPSRSSRMGTRTFSIRVECWGAWRIIPSRDRSSPRGFVCRRRRGRRRRRGFTRSRWRPRAAVGMGPSALLSGCPRTAPRDRPTPRVPPLRGGDDGLSGGVSNVVAGLCATPRRRGRRRAGAPPRALSPCWVLSARVEGGVDGDWAASVAGLEKRVCFARRCFRRWRRTARVRGWWARWTSCWKSRRSARGETLRGAARDERGWKARHL